MQPYEEFLESTCSLFRSDSEPLLVAGWSIGGMIAMELLARANYRNDKSLLVLISSSNNFTASSTERKESLERLISHVVQVISSPSKTVLKGFYQELVEEYKLFSSSGPDLIKLLQQTRHLSLKGLLNALKYLLHTDISQKASEISVPTLLIHGSHDLIIPTEHSKTLHRLIPDSKLEIIPDSGHMIPFTHSDTIISLIEKELA
jgi:pimeloyl-ACP methyl ester carboxylesterase